MEGIEYTGRKYTIYKKWFFGMIRRKEEMGVYSLYSLVEMVIGSQDRSFDVVLPLNTVA